MKWLGQYVQSLTSRFRSDVYLESISTGTIASGAHLGLDSNNKIVKAVDGGGDLTSIVAGTGLSGTSLTGPIPTLNVDASQTQITSVGTIGTGVWQGTTIKTAYIGDDQVTEDKLANTLLAEIDANTAKVTNVSTNLAITGSTDAKTITSSDGTNAVIPVATTETSGVMSTGLFDAVTANTAKATNVTTNLTATTHASQITINSSDGTNVVVAEASGSIAGVMSVTHHDKLDAIEASATADQSKSDIDGLAITTVGTIDTGVWQGTKVASAYLDDDTAHLSAAQTFTGTNKFTARAVTFDGDKNVDPGDGAVIHVDAHDVTDINTSASGTAAMYTHVNIEAPRLLATNASVTTTAAASLYIQGSPSASTNQTITNPYALWVDDGLVKFDGALTVGGTITGDVTGDLTGQADTVATIAGLAPNTATTQASQPNITGVGTIGTGVWNGTAIATDQQKHLMHYQVQGYSAGSTNYVASKNIATNTAPFKHDVDIGSDGTTAKSVTVWMRTGGHVMPNACTLKRFTGWTETAGGGTAYVGLFRVRLSDDSDTDPSAVLLQEVTYTASGNQIADYFNVTSASGGQSLDLAAGDIIFSALKGAGNPTYFNGTFEVEF